MTSYCEAVNCSLETSATNDIIVETDTDMMQHTQQLNKASTKYAEALWNKALRCDSVNDEYVLKDILLKACRNRSPTVCV